MTMKIPESVIAKPFLSVLRSRIVLMRFWQVEIYKVNEISQKWEKYFSSDSILHQTEKERGHYCM
jgi:hypothetical protein